MPSYPIFGSQPDMLPAQIYNWAQTDLAQQNNNINRATQRDQQAITNRQNYFQAQQEFEQRDYLRQQQAQQESYRRRQLQDDVDRKKYEFKTNLDLKKQERTDAIDYYDKTFKAQEEADNAANLSAQSKAEANLIEQVRKGNTSRSWDVVAAENPEVDPSRVKEILQRILPDNDLKTIGNVNAMTAEARSKIPPADWMQHEKEYTENLRRVAMAKLPPEIRGQVVFNSETLQFAPITPPNHNLDEVRARESEMSGGYNFAPTPQQAQTAIQGMDARQAASAPPPANPVAPQQQPAPQSAPVLPSSAPATPPSQPIAMADRTVVPSQAYSALNTAADVATRFPIIELGAKALKWGAKNVPTPANYFMSDPQKEAFQRVVSAIPTEAPRFRPMNEVGYSFRDLAQGPVASAAYENVVRPVANAYVGKAQSAYDYFRSLNPEKAMPTPSAALPEYTLPQLPKKIESIIGKPYPKDVVQVNSLKDYRALRVGTWYLDSNGKLAQKKKK